MDDLLHRVWENLVSRPTGPMSFRLIIQPLVAGILAIRSGIKDGREGRPAFLWGAITDPVHRADLLRQAWKDVWKVFVFAGVLDGIYQLITHHGVYIGELLIIATALAIVPYCLIRGPVARITRLRLAKKQSSPVSDKKFQGETHGN